MVDFTIHTVESAPEGAKALLEDSQKSFGMVPNLHAAMAESPEALDAYKQLTVLFSKTSLTSVEQNVLWMAINVENRCHYCVPAHTVIARGAGVDEDTLTALRAGTALADTKLESLRQFALAVVRQRGEATDAQVEAFVAAGFTKRNIFDVLLGVTHKTLSNYTNHIVKTPVDAAFAGEAWDAPPRAAAE